MTAFHTITIPTGLTDEDRAWLVGLLEARDTQRGKLAVRGAEAAEMLSMSHDKLRDLAYRGVVPSFVVDGMRLYPVEQLARWVAAQVTDRDSEAESTAA